jgi:hypothetical protein
VEWTTFPWYTNYELPRSADRYKIWGKYEKVSLKEGTVEVAFPAIKKRYTMSWDWVRQHGSCNRMEGKETITDALIIQHEKEKKKEEGKTFSNLNPTARKGVERIEYRILDEIVIQEKGGNEGNLGIGILNINNLEANHDLALIGWMASRLELGIQVIVDARITAGGVVKEKKGHMGRSNRNGADHRNIGMD